MRLLASITIQPHLDRRHRITPEKLLPLPWDSVKSKAREAPRITKEEQRERMRRLVDKLGDELIQHGR